MMYPDEFVTAKSKLPTEPHWVILKFSSISIPGDERSRTNPGHGYSAHSVPNVKYDAYLTEEKFLAALQELEERGYTSDSYVALKVEPLKITKTVSVSAE